MLNIFKTKKQRLIEKVLDVNRQSIELSKEHSKLLNKYTVEELENIYSNGILALEQTKAVIKQLQRR